jgi:L-rhamnose mutarotase
MLRTLTLAACAFCAAALMASAAAAQEKAAAITAAAAGPGTPAAAQGKYFEMRIYTAAEGKMDALHARFRDHTLKLFKKHGIENVAYWTAVDQKNAGKLYFVIAYPDKASRDTLWNAFTSDPEWKAAQKASEANGKLVDKVEQVFMTGTDYSPIK